MSIKSEHKVNEHKKVRIKKCPLVLGWGVFKYINYKHIRDEMNLEKLSLFFCSIADRVFKQQTCITSLVYTTCFKPTIRVQPYVTFKNIPFYCSSAMLNFKRVTLVFWLK
jgi:hypothetical protein